MSAIVRIYEFKTKKESNILNRVFFNSFVFVIITRLKDPACLCRVWPSPKLFSYSFQSVLKQNICMYKLL